MIDRTWLTSHERVVITSALAAYRAAEDRKSHKSTVAKTRAMASAKVFVASSLLQQITQR